MRIVHPGETERLKQNVEMQRRLGVNVKLIDREELKDLEPDWAVDEVELAAYEPDSGYGDGAGVANDFLSRARDLGVAYCPRPKPWSFLSKADACAELPPITGRLRRRSWSSPPPVPGPGRCFGARNRSAD